MKDLHEDEDMDAFAHELFGDDDGDAIIWRSDSDESMDEDTLEACWLEEAKISFDGLDRLTFRLPAATVHRA